MSSESHSLGKTNTSSAFLDLGTIGLFSLDETRTLSSTSYQTLRIQWFGDTFATPFGKPTTFRADRRSDTENTVLSEAASSKMLEVDFVRQNKYFERSTKLLYKVGTTHVMFSALGGSRTLRIQWFERWSFSLDETRGLSAAACSGSTNTMV